MVFCIPALNWGGNLLKYQCPCHWLSKIFLGLFGDLPYQVQFFIPSPVWYSGYFQGLYCLFDHCMTTMEQCPLRTELLYTKVIMVICIFSWSFLMISLIFLLFCYDKPAASARCTLIRRTNYWKPLLRSQTNTAVFFSSGYIEVFHIWETSIMIKEDGKLNIEYNVESKCKHIDRSCKQGCRVLKLCSKLSGTLLLQSSIQPKIWQPRIAVQKHHSLVLNVVSTSG